MAEKVRVRVAVGAALLAGALAFLALDHVLETGWCYGGLVALVLAGGSVELARLTEGAGAPARGALLVAAVPSFVLLRVAAEELRLPWLREAEPALLAVVMIGLVVHALAGTPSREKLLSLATTTFGLVYLGILGSFSVRARYVAADLVDAETTTLFLLLVAKVPDIFGYFVGRTLGKTKLIPSVSPGKTVAGFVGALAGGVIVTLAFSRLTSLGRAIPPAWAVPVGILLGLGSVAGDLSESLVKRAAGVKDSASLFPTFGGVLDVIDSFLVSSPVLYAVLAVAAALGRAQA